MVGRSSSVDCCWNDLLADKRRLLSDSNQDHTPEAVLRSVWIDAQLQTFPRELTCLLRGKLVLADSDLYKYVPFLDSFGVMRAHSRFQTGESDFDSPIVVDARGQIGRAWLEWLHLSNGHLGVPALMTHAREFHLVFQLRSVARNVCSRCMDCRRRLARPINPPAGKLPSFRTDGNDAFRYIGVDFFGPLFVARNAKRYVLLATCLTSRAVHLEVLWGMTAGDVWTGLRRLFSLRQVPVLIYSDNGTSFVRLSKEIRVLNDALVELSTSGNLPHTIKWKFSSPFASHQGGVFERLVGLVKAHIPPSMKSHRLSTEELSTAMFEISAIVNSRPIGVLDDVTPLTPGHLVSGGRPLSWPALDYQFPGTLMSSHAFFRRRQDILQRFWIGWRRAYLASLTDRFTLSHAFVSLKVGDTVLMVDSSSHRNHWKIGRIVEVIPGPDDIVRSVEVEVDGVRYRRAVQSLARFEEDAPLSFANIN